jgi:hypothetical protein
LFQNDLNSIVVEFDKATKEAKTMSIFVTIFLERKFLLTLLTFRMVLEATGGGGMPGHHPNPETP